MPLKLTSIEQAFRANIRTLLGMPENSVRRANQFDPPPAGDQETQFATVFIQQVGGIGWDEITHANPTIDQDGYGQGGSGDGGAGTGAVNDVTEFITGNHLFVASVQFFRGDAIDQIERLGMLLQSSPSIQALLAAGIGLGKIGAIRNLSQVVDSFYENRAQMDVEFYVVDREQVDLATFGFFPVTINSDDYVPPVDSGYGEGGAGDSGAGEND
jgi:hypothetical protein